MSDDTKEEQMTDAQKLVEQLTDAFNDKVDRFDELLNKACDCDSEVDFIQSYMQLRESGFTFEDAYNTAAEEYDLEKDEEEVEEGPDDK